MSMVTQIIIGALCALVGIVFLVRKPDLQGWNLMGLKINYGAVAIIFFILALVWIVRGVAFGS